MDWRAWRPLYEQILDDFGFDPKADEAARDLLVDLLRHRAPVDLQALRARFAGREAWIVGAIPADLARVPPDAPLLVTDGAAAWALPLRRPDAIVTDLDGDVATQAVANAMGVPVFLHAHGDNADALRRHAPAFRGPLVATTQAAPVDGARCFGGFTDGDRAVCIAAELGAASLALVGFDFEAPAAKPGRDPAVKRRKLEWARRILDATGVPWRLA